MWTKRDCSSKWSDIDPVPWPLTFEPQNSTTSRVSQGYSLYQVWALWIHSFLSYDAAEKQTDELENPTQVDRHSNKLQ